MACWTRTHGPTGVWLLFLPPTCLHHQAQQMAAGKLPACITLQLFQLLKTILLPFKDMLCRAPGSLQGLSLMHGRYSTECTACD